MTQPARRGITGWPGVALVGFAFAATMLGTTLPTPLYPLYAARLGFGVLVSTVVFSMYAVGVVTALVLLGHWSDTLGRRPLLLAALGLSALSAGVFLLPTALPWLFVGRALSGLSAGIATGTATATIVDLAPDGSDGPAAFVAAMVNMGGLGAGPLLAGFLAQYAPGPLRLCFVVDLVLICVGVAAILLTREPVDRLGAAVLRPRRPTVPVEMRGLFIRAAIAGFAGFAVLGLFTAVSTAFLGLLGVVNHAVVGVVVVALFAASVAGQSASARVGLDRAMAVGCAVLIVGMLAIAASLLARSLSLLVAGAVVAGLGQGLSFRGALGSVAGASPPAVRGAVTSTWFVVIYVGISLPVIGEGALASRVGLVDAGVVFAVLVAALAAAALALLLRSDTARGAARPA